MKLEIIPMTLKEGNFENESGLRWTGKRRPEVDLYPAEKKLQYQREVSS